MSKISNAKGRTDNNSGYSRVIKNQELGLLLSKVQATIISNGSELEKMILERTNKISDLNNFIDETAINKTPNGIYTAPKKILRKSRYALKGYEPDLLIFIVREARLCEIIELKEGDSFDTKKSAGEREHLVQFTKDFGSKIPFITNYYICCFYQNDKQKIYNGFKKNFEMENILTGKDLCKILEIDYDEIVNLRKKDSIDNFNYFLDELLKIDEVKNYLIEKINK